MTSISFLSNMYQSSRDTATDCPTRQSSSIQHEDQLKLYSHASHMAGGGPECILPASWNSSKMFMHDVYFDLNK